MDYVKNIFLLIIFPMICFNPVFWIESQTVQLKDAKVIVAHNKIRVTTGVVSCEWEVTTQGLSVTKLHGFGIKNLVDSKDDLNCWNLSEIKSPVKLLGISVETSTDDGFTNSHIKVVAEFQYSELGIDVRYEIWAYPDAPGIRTQLFIKKIAEVNSLQLDFGTSEALSLNKRIKNIKAVGYYNDTQHRNKKDTPILKSEVLENNGDLKVDWASIADFKLGKSGIILVKESPKCVNQQSVNTGGFSFSENSVNIYGLGIDESSLTSEYQPCWANWIVLYKGDEDNMQLALKKFDRIRYPIDNDRDIYIMANTWGSGDTGANSKYASREENILKEIDVAEEIGVEVVQIDDGWQGSGYKDWRPVKNAIYKNDVPGTKQLLPNGTQYEVFPEGWENVRREAVKSNIKLGLWNVSWIPFDDLAYNYLNGDFRYYKLDFANLESYGSYQELISRVRRFTLFSGSKIRINWDVTENMPRMGYYFGREYGNIYLENRKPVQPENVVYRPWLVLRDAWHVAKYANLNKFQITYQNIDMVNKQVSDAYLYEHRYCLAATLMGAPLFFQELHLLSKEAKTEIKSLIKVYKQNRAELFNGYVFAIGDEPTNSSWSGFQNVGPDKDGGYLTIFRELNNNEDIKIIELKFLKNKTIQLLNLENGFMQMKPVDKEGRVEFTGIKKGGFIFFKYTVVKKNL